MKFFTKYDSKERVHPRIGDHFLNTYRLEHDSSGAEILVPNGCIDVYERMQAATPAQEISNIYARFCNGDATALNVRKGIYVDARKIPDNIIELNNMITKAEDDFYSLPSELRELFNNNPSDFYNSYGSDYFNGIISDFYKDDTSTPESEVIDNE